MSSSKVESAELILKLYDLRREAKMREARNWMFTFKPKSAEDVMKTMMDPEVGGYLRMVTSYWDMAAALVNHEAIDAQMFNDTQGEHLMVYAILEPFVPELRQMWDEPKAFAHLEKVILSQPDGAKRVKATQEWMKSIQGETEAAAA
ncbi:MAG: hypothetical protein LC730_02670 [Acidobacteria bacterium]|nr:hypothetical protein [Acidobacteriota bacterium]MCA1608347.1 hypothetical protein [Acidobacteriota bacterium]